METRSRLKKKDRYYVTMARAAASASRCPRAQFGCVIVSSDDRLIASSYNGKPRNSTCDHICFREGLTPNSPKQNCDLHAELNAILFSSPLERKGGTLYCTGKPCSDCSLAIMNSGLSRLVYLVVEDGSHPGWVGEDIFTLYGSTIERVPYTDALWEEQFR